MELQKQIEKTGNTITLLLSVDENTSHLVQLAHQYSAQLISVLKDIDRLKASLRSTKKDMYRMAIIPQGLFGGGHKLYKNVLDVVDPLTGAAMKLRLGGACLPKIAVTA